VERQSTKHGPRVDDALKKEVESLERSAPVEARRDDYREQEGAADGEREPGARTAPPGQLALDAPDARAELSRHLRPSAFPADRDRLLAEARANNAPAEVVATLERLPEGWDFVTVYEVWEALGGEVEHVQGRRERRS
jgi:hypothetical protein